MIDLIDVEVPFAKRATYRVKRIFSGENKAKEYFLKKQKNEAFRLVRDLCAGHSSVKLNLGCGDVYLDGWINIDNRNDGVPLDIKHDLTQGLPFDDNSVDFIFNEHFFEHITPEDGVVFLKECRRVLKKGGVLRIAMPHIKPVLDRYYNDKWHEEPWLKKYGCDWIKTRAEVVNIGFRAWGHQWLYDEEELERRLQEGGFTNIAARKIYESPYEELRNMETREGSELVYEAVKS